MSIYLALSIVSVHQLYIFIWELRSWGNKVKIIKLPTFNTIVWYKEIMYGFILTFQDFSSPTSVFSLTMTSLFVL